MTDSIDGRLKHTGVKKEVAGVVFLALGIYLAVCLLSGISSSKLGGPIGEYVAGAVFYSFGYSSYIIPFLLIFIAFKLLLRRLIAISSGAPLGLAVLLFSSSALFALLSAEGTAGGKVGVFIGEPLSQYAGPTGAAVILLAISLIALLGVTGVRLHKKNGGSGKKAPPIDTNFDGFQQ